MTELDLAIELDLCGQEITIVVAECKCSKKYWKTGQDKKWSNIDSNKHIQWCDFGNSPGNVSCQGQKRNLMDTPTDYINGDNRIDVDTTKNYDCSITKTPTSEIDIIQKDSLITGINGGDYNHYDDNHCIDVNTTNKSNFPIDGVCHALNH